MRFKKKHLWVVANRSHSIRTASTEGGCAWWHHSPLKHSCLVSHVSLMVSRRPKSNSCHFLTILMLSLNFSWWSEPRQHARTQRVTALADYMLALKCSWMDELSETLTCELIFLTQLHQAFNAEHMSLNSNSPPVTWKWICCSETNQACCAFSLLLLLLHLVCVVSVNLSFKFNLCFMFAGRFNSQ